MKRVLLSAALAFACAAGLNSAEVQAKELRFSLYFSGSSTTGSGVLKPWFKWFAERSGGTTIKLFDDGALGRDPTKQYKLVNDGVLFGMMSAVMAVNLAYGFHSEARRWEASLPLWFWRMYSIGAAGAIGAAWVTESGLIPLAIFLIGFLFFMFMMDRWRRDWTLRQSLR